MKRNLVILNIYRPPHISIREFNKEKENMRDKLEKENKYVNVMGDFYIDTYENKELKFNNNFTNTF